MDVLLHSASDAPFPGHFCRELLSLLSAHPSRLTLLAAFPIRSRSLFFPNLASEPTLLVSAEAGQVYLGPLSRPGVAPCFHCLAHWLRLTSSNIAPSLSPGIPEARFAAAVALAAAREFDATNAIPRFARCLTAFDLASGRSSAHPVFPLQNCPSCAACAPRTGFRPEIHCSSLTGVVPAMQITTEPDAGAFRALGDWRAPLRSSGLPPLAAQRSYGRGSTRQAAIHGCVGEALERYSIIFRGDELLLRASLRQLSDSGVQAVDPRSLLLFSERQYGSRLDWNSTRDDRFFVPQPFSPDALIGWLPARNLLNGSPALAPAACCLMWYSAPEPLYASADSIGCGSGPTLPDAILHALLEAIERDALALWWYNRARRPAVLLESFEDPALLAVRDNLERLGRRLFLLDVTTDVGIPAYVAVAPLLNGAEPLFAAAAHLSPRTAAWKAATEVGQLWHSPVHEGAIDSELHAWISHATLSSQPYLVPACEISAPPEPPPFPGPLPSALARLSAASLTPFAVDLTRPDVCLFTARALVPGLRHLWHRLAPGRLYSVPRELGWWPAALSESDLNPIPCML